MVLTLEFKLGFQLLGAPEVESKAAINGRETPPIKLKLQPT